VRSESAAPQHVRADHILPWLRRLRLDWLLQHFPQRLVRSAYVFVNGFIATDGAVTSVIEGELLNLNR